MMLQRDGGKGPGMPRLVFYEAGNAPGPRSARVLRSIAGLGWEITVVHHRGETGAVEALRLDSRALPEAPGNLIAARLATRRTELLAMREQLRHRIDELSAESAGGDETELARLRSEQAPLSLRLNAIDAIRSTPAPLEEGVAFGDLARIEGEWHDAARAIASIDSDVLWAAGLDSLPPAIWASQVPRPRQPAVVFDTEQLFDERPDVPDLYRAAWRQVAKTFTPLATTVVAGSEPLAQALRDEHGAKRIEVLPTYAMPGRSVAARLRVALRLKPDSGLRARLGLGPRTPLAVQLLDVGPVGDSTAPVDLLAGVDGLHLAVICPEQSGFGDAICSAARMRGVGSRLHLVPAQRAAIDDADLVVFPPPASRGGALWLPAGVYDSLAAGVPVLVAKDTAAARLVLDGRLGGTYSTTDAGDIAAAARRVLDDTSICANVRARRREFVWHRNEPAIRALLRELRGPRESSAPAAA